MQEFQGTEVAVDSEFDEYASLHAVDSSKYQVKLDYNGNSVGVEFLNATKVTRVEVKHFTGYVSELKHPLSSKQQEARTDVQQLCLGVQEIILTELIGLNLVIHYYPMS